MLFNDSDFFSPRHTATSSNDDQSTRLEYGQLRHTPPFASVLISAAKNAQDITPGWTTISSSRSAKLSVDLYGYDEQKGLAVIQVRLTIVHRRKRYANVWKNWFLIGRNEDGTAFAHSIPSPRRAKAALETPESTVEWALCKIWDVKPEILGQIIRQGDLAFVPVKRLPNRSSVLPDTTTLLLRNSHTLHAPEILKSPDDKYFVRKGATLVHEPGQHETISVEPGRLYRVAIGYREPHWDFAAETAD